VVAVAVELDGEATAGPVAVHAPAAYRPVGLRKRQPRLEQPPEEPPFERAEGDADLSAQDLPQARRARAGGASREDRLDVGGDRAVADPGLVTGAGEVRSGEDGSEVDEPARDGGDRDPPPRRRVGSVPRPRGG